MRVGLFPSFSLLVRLQLSDISPRQAVMINSRVEGLGGEVRGRCTAGPRPSVSSGRLCMGVSRVGLSSWSPEAPLLQRASHGSAKLLAAGAAGAVCSTSFNTICKGKAG